MVVLNQDKQREEERVSRHTRNTCEQQVTLILTPLKDIKGPGIY